MIDIVSIIHQQNYDPRSLRSSISKSIELTAFDMSSVNGKRILLKPNMLGAFLPEMGVTTNPSFLREVINIFQSHSAIVEVGDSPNGVHPPNEVWRISGIEDICRETGAKAIQFEKSGSITRGEYMISNAVTDADIIINLPKFKTHGLTALTLAVKNLFGCVNGMLKTKLHRDSPNGEEFSKEIVKIAELIQPDLTIVDGIIAMAGNGPSAGELVNLGAIVAGTNIHAVDSVCAEIIGIDPIEVNTITAAVELGYWKNSETIDLLGDDPSIFGGINFPMPSTFRSKKLDWWISRFLLDRIWSNISAKPEIIDGKCIRCNMCHMACPVRAISKANQEKPPIIDKSKCIECFCCHEICPKSAIELKTSTLLKIIKFFSNRRIKSQIKKRGRK